MPNYCENDLQIYGEPKDVMEVLKFISSDESIFDFNKVFPYPSKYKELDDRAHNFDKEASLIAPEDTSARNALLKKYGLVSGQLLKDGYNQGGYEWCHTTWGTKWNACEPRLDERAEDSGEAVFHFDTAWSPPHPVIRKLAELFPLVEFTHEWYERGMAFCGSATYVNGEVSDYAESKYYGIRGG